MSDPLQIVIYTRGLPITGEDPVDLGLGGSETAVVSMARGLARAGCGVRVVCNTGGAVRRAGVEFLPAAEGLAVLGREPCDVFLSCRYHQVLDEPVPARMVALWNHDMPDGDLPRRAAAALSKASLSFFLSDFHRREFEKHVPGISGFARVTSNGVDFDALAAAAAEAEPAGAGPLFLYGSRPERGLGFLLRRIWPRILSRHPEARLLVSSYDVGALELPPELAEYYGFCRELAARTPGVAGPGSLTRRQFWRRLAGATAVLYPTDFPEISCMVALEAQAAGVPIVTSDRFALSETVGCAELRVGEEWGSEAYVEAFVERALRLVEEPAFRERAVAAGRDHVTPGSHSWDALARSWQEIFLAGFEKRMESEPGGLLRGLLAASEIEAARRLVAAVPEPAASFDAGDLEELGRRGAAAGGPPAAGGPAPSAKEAVFRTPPRPRVSATILVKDEEANIRRCVESFAGIVDEIVVGDTGSSDLTVEILESLGFSDLRAVETSAPPPYRRVVRVDFEDFAQARNELAKHATGDYIFWQDADEILVGAEALRSWVDGNVFYDAFALEQRHLSFDGRIEPSHPIRLFRPQTADGPLGWVGCVHELVEHEVNRGPQRMTILRDVYVGHFGYPHRGVSWQKVSSRNLALLVKDRRQNPGRWMGYVLGMRECLNLARFELQRHGTLTVRGYRYLNLGFAIWDRHVRELPEAYRRLGRKHSREILELLARHKLPARRTGKVPFQADYSFAAQRGVLDLEGGKIPRNRIFFATVEELRREFDERLDRLEDELAGTAFERPAETLPPGEEDDAPGLAAELFGIGEEDL